MQLPGSDLALVAITTSKPLSGALAGMAEEHGWKLFVSSRLWEGFAAVQNGAANMVLLDENHLGTDWRDCLNAFLQPAHPCCVMLIAPGEHKRFSEAFMNAGGFRVIHSPLDGAELAEAVQSARACRANLVKPGVIVKL